MMVDPCETPSERGVVETDIVIIGAGPTGLFAIFQCGMLKMRAHVIDALDMPGGQCAALYPEKPIYDIPAYPSLAAQDLVDRLVAQAAPFQPVYHWGQQAVALKALSDGRWLVETDRGTRLACKGVMIAAGAGAFGPNKPPLPGLADYEGSSIFYMVRRREDFRGKRVVIAGGGDSAVDWANSLSDVADKVMLVHRRDKFRAAPESVARLRSLTASGGVELVTPYQLAGLEGEGGVLTGVLVEDLDGGVRTLPADVLLPFFGLSMNLGPIATWGAALAKGHLAVDPATLATSLPGIHAIGDIAVYPGKLKLILCGFSEAAMAAHALYARVYPDQALHFEYSTTKGASL
jgi:thioredoxin reductase (NADPH)